MGEKSLGDADVLDTAMLRARGFSQKQIQTLVRRGRLHRVERGVFTTAEPTGLLLLRALAHTRPGLVFTGRTAIELHTGQPLTLPVQGLVPVSAQPTRTDLLHLRRRSGIRHRRVQGVRVVVGVVAVADATGLPDARLLDFLETFYAHKHGKDLLEVDLASMTRRPARLTDLLARAAIGADSPPELEVFRAVRARGLAVEQNFLLAGYRFDGALRGAKVLVEIDGYAHHASESRGAFVRDRWKANVATRRGWRVLRYSGSCVRHHLDHVVEQIVAAAENRPTLLFTERQVVWRWHETLNRESPW